MKRISDENIFLCMQKYKGDIAKVSREISLSRQSLYTRLKSDSYKKAVKEQQRKHFERVSLELQTLSDTAISTLKTIMMDKNATDNARIRACLGVLDYSLRFRTSCDFEERIEALEDLTLTESNR